MITLDALQIIGSYWLKPTLGLWLVLFMIRRPDFRSASSSHRVLLYALVLMLGLTLFRSLLPELTLHLLPQSLIESALFSVSLVSPSSATLGFYLLMGVYFLGVCWVACYTAQGIRDAYRLTRASRELNCSDEIHLQPVISALASRFVLSSDQPRIVVSAYLNTPLVWRWKDPVIVLPEIYADWGKDRLLRVLAHEYAHVERNDWPVKMAVRCLCALFWFVPLVWVVSRKIDVFAEVACDDRVIQLFQCRADYADDLLALSADARHQAFALSYLRRSELYQRISMVLDPCRSRETPSLQQQFWVLVILVVAFFPLVTTQVYGDDNFEALFDLRAFPVQQQLPMLIVPEESPIANINHRLDWLLRQQLLDNAELELGEQEHGEMDGDKTLNDELNKNYQQAFALVRAPRPEENMLVRYFIHEGESLKPLSDIPIESETLPIDMPSVRIEGYLPLETVSPQYPRMALNRKMNGRVVVQFDVNEAGFVTNANIVYAQPRRVFDKAVLRAVKQFRFLPLKVDGKPVITKHVNETFVFKIETPKKS